MATIERALVAGALAALVAGARATRLDPRPAGRLVGCARVRTGHVHAVLYREALDRGDEHSLPFVLYPARALRVPDRRLGAPRWSTRANARTPACATGRSASARSRSRSTPSSRRTWVTSNPPGRRSSRACAGRGHRRRARRARAARDSRLPRALARPTPQPPRARSTPSPSGRAATGFLEPALFRFHGDAHRGQDRARPPRGGGAARRRSGAARREAAASLAAGDRRALPRNAVLGARRAGGGVRARSDGGTGAARTRRRAVRARAHAARAGHRSAPRAQEAPGPRIARGRARDLPDAGRSALGGARPRRARARRRPGEHDRD